jgi:hypothetical protein
VSGKSVGGTLTPATADARGWGWQVKASINAATPRPFYDKAKELYFGNAGAQYLNGYVLSADTRMVQNGPARDGWVPPARGGGAGRGAAPGGRGRGDSTPEPDAEPVIGLPGTRPRPRPRRRGVAAAAR